MFFDFAIPTRIARCTTEEELIKIVNTWNGICPCYISVNPYDVISMDEFGNEIKKAYITRAFFDFDNDLESVKKLVDYLIIKDIKFNINHSGRGHHVYIHLTGEGDGRNLRILQLSILNEAKTTCDLHVVGDVSRVSRVPNTWNFSANKYCIPIKVEELGKEDGSQQRFETFIYGTKLLNLSSYTEDRFESIKPEIIKGMKINTNIVLLPCIRNIISKINPNNVERYTLVVFLSNAIRNGKDLRGFDRYTIADEIFKFFEINCSHWMDFNRRITRYQIENIVNKTNIIVGCRFLKSKNVCVDCISGGI